MVPDILSVDKSWTLFLDRDGVINELIKGEYIKEWNKFKFTKGAQQAIAKLSGLFGRILIITNQSGIGKGAMTEDALNSIHKNMTKEIEQVGGKIEKIYYCPHDYLVENCDCRKPKDGMINQAKGDFRDIDFAKSVLVGDMEKDIILGRSIGACTVHISQDAGNSYKADFVYPSLYDFAHGWE